MWALVLMTVTGSAMTAIPGYRSQALCYDAGMMFMQRYADVANPKPAFVCIPSPS
jgi:hypothetical protein